MDRLSNLNNGTSSKPDKYVSTARATGSRLTSFRDDCEKLSFMPKAAAEKICGAPRFGTDASALGSAFVSVEAGLREM